jgi:uncharacterized protein YbaA (DUF1428 family)
MEYVDGFLIPVARSKKAAYRDLAARTAPIFKEHGALRVVECWIDEADVVPNEFFHAADARPQLASAQEDASAGFRAAAGAGGDEAVVLAWIEWPNRAARDSGMKLAMEDPRMQFDDGESVFAGDRLIASGFIPILRA